MTIGIDARTYFLRSGIGRYCRNTCDAMARLAPETQFAWLISNQKSARDFDPQPTNRHLSVTRASLNDTEAETQWLVADMAATGAQVAWFPSFTMPESLGIPGAATIHDLTVFSLPDCHEAATVAYVSSAIEKTALLADAILVDSDCTRVDLLERFPGLKGRIWVAYPGVDRSLFSQAGDDGDGAVLTRFNLEAGRYFLYAGSIEPRKNIERLIEAYSTCPAARDTVLVLAGLPRWKSQGVLNRIASHGGPGRILLPGFIADEDLPPLYRNALAFVYPSLYEGFGLPPLEAMACGAPVITSRRSSLPEVTGDAALLVDPEDTGELSDALQRLADDAALRSDLAARGHERAAGFSWEMTAAQVLACLQEVRSSVLTALG